MYAGRAFGLQFSRAFPLVQNRGPRTLREAVGARLEVLSSHMQVGYFFPYLTLPDFDTLARV